MKYLLLFLLLLSSCNNSIELIHIEDTSSKSLPSEVNITIVDNITPTPELSVKFSEEEGKIKIAAISSIIPDNYFWYVDRKLYSSNSDYIILDSYIEVTCIIVKDDIIWSVTV